MVNEQRPPCPETNCQLLCSTCYNPWIFRDGGTFFCVGKVIDTDKIRFIANKMDHHNNYHFCVWTPMKGWVKFMFNHYDLYLITMGINAILSDEGQPLIDNSEWDTSYIIEKKKED